MSLSPLEPSGTPVASAGPAGTLVGGLSSGSLGLSGRERLQLAAPVCLHNFWFPLTLTSWWVYTAVATGFMLLLPVYTLGYLGG